ncbi:hypothetical protein B5S33_g1611 [[Candida] boidinii]|nr:hypothetical protein B5S33_g1611 [[Candida] boidinii]
MMFRLNDVLPSNLGLNIPPQSTTTATATANNNNNKNTYNNNTTVPTSTSYNTTPQTMNQNYDYPVNNINKQRSNKTDSYNNLKTASDPPSGYSNSSNTNRRINTDPPSSNSHSNNTNTNYNANTNTNTHHQQQQPRRRINVYPPPQSQSQQNSQNRNVSSPDLSTLPNFMRTPNPQVKFHSAFPPLTTQKQYKSVMERAGFEIYKPQPQSKSRSSSSKSTPNLSSSKRFSPPNNSTNNNTQSVNTNKNTSNPNLNTIQDKDDFQFHNSQPDSNNTSNLNTNTNTKFGFSQNTTAPLSIIADSTEKLGLSPFKNKKSTNIPQIPMNNNTNNKTAVFSNQIKSPDLINFSEPQSNIPNHHLIGSTIPLNPLEKEYPKTKSPDFNLENNRTITNPVINTDSNVNNPFHFSSNDQSKTEFKTDNPFNFSSNDQNETDFKTDNPLLNADSDSDSDSEFGFNKKLFSNNDKNNNSKLVLNNNEIENSNKNVLLIPNIKQDSKDDEEYFSDNVSINNSINEFDAQFESDSNSSSPVKKLLAKENNIKNDDINYDSDNASEYFPASDIQQPHSKAIIEDLKDKNDLKNIIDSLDTDDEDQDDGQDEDQDEFDKQYNYDIRDSAIPTAATSTPTSNSNPNIIINGSKNNDDSLDQLLSMKNALSPIRNGGATVPHILINNFDNPLDSRSNVNSEFFRSSTSSSMYKDDSTTKRSSIIDSDDAKIYNVVNGENIINNNNNNINNQLAKTDISTIMEVTEINDDSNLLNENESEIKDVFKFNKTPISPITDSSMYNPLADEEDFNSYNPSNTDEMLMQGLTKVKLNPLESPDMRKQTSNKGYQQQNETTAAEEEIGASHEPYDNGFAEKMINSSISSVDKSSLFADDINRVDDSMSPESQVITNDEFATAKNNHIQDDSFNNSKNKNNLSINTNRNSTSNYSDYLPTPTINSHSQLYQNSTKTHHDATSTPGTVINDVASSINSLPTKNEEVKYDSGTGPCRRCHNEITGKQKSIWSKDFQLSGQWHRKCFLCYTCNTPFRRGESCYVFEDKPYCETHFHELNGTICKICGKGVEGECLENEIGEIFHSSCLTCHYCNNVIKSDYFVYSNHILCENDAIKQSKLLKENGGVDDKVSRRRTKFLYL